MKIAILTLTAFIYACTSQSEVQDEYTSDNNYFDYEYYSEDIGNNNFNHVYDYPYYEEPEYIYDTPAPPVLLEEAPEKKPDDWFFDDY